MIQKIPHRRLILLAVLSLVGILLATYLTQHYYDIRNGTAAFKSLCNVGGSLNCDVVTASRYAELLFGLPLSSFVVGWLAALGIIALLARNPAWHRESVRAATAMAGVGVFFSLLQLGIMIWVLKSYCLFCLLVDVTNIASLGLVLSMRPEKISLSKLNFKQWKSFTMVTSVALIIAVGGLKITFDTPPARGIAQDAMVESVLNTPTLSVNSGPEFSSIGPVNAPITLVEYSDFECPYCRIGAMTVNSLINRFPGKIRVVFRNLPLDMSCNRDIQKPMHLAACEAAKVAWCSYQQGKFREVYETLFDKQTSLKPGKPLEFAVTAGANAASLKACVDSSEAATAISRDIDEATLLGIHSTPTFFLNGRKIEGILPLPVWERIIEQLLARQ